MNKNGAFMYFAACIAFILATLFVSADSTFAQKANDNQTNEPIEEIVKIEAAVERRIVGRPNELGARTEVLELRRQVSFADLDLREEENVVELKSRVADTAKESCEELADRHPIPAWGASDIRRCIAEAVEGANADVEEIVAAL